MPDLNGDGVRDLLLGSSQGFYWIEGNADLSFQQNRELRTGVLGGTTLGIGDLDGDGAADLVGIDLSTNQVVVLSAGGTRFATLAVGALNPAAVAVGQLDGQGGDDLAVTYKGTVDHLSYFRGGSGAPVDVSIAACTGGFLQTGRFAAGSTLDLLLCCADRVQLLIGAGDGTFTPGLPFAIAQPGGKEVGAPAIADFDGDGDLDVMILQLPVTGATSADVVLLENTDGRGTLTARPQPVSVPVSVSALVDVGDVNGDSKPDLVIGERMPSSPTPLTVLLNVSR